MTQIYADGDAWEAGRREMGDRPQMTQIGTDAEGVGRDDGEKRKAVIRRGVRR
jgi:hypothetical protein